METITLDKWMQHCWGLPGDCPVDQLPGSTLYWLDEDDSVDYEVEFDSDDEVVWEHALPEADEYGLQSLLLMPRIGGEGEVLPTAGVLKGDLQEPFTLFSNLGDSLIYPNVRPAPDFNPEQETVVSTLQHMESLIKGRLEALRQTSDSEEEELLSDDSDQEEEEEEEEEVSEEIVISRPDGSIIELTQEELDMILQKRKKRVAEESLVQLQPQLKKHLKDLDDKSAAFQFIRDLEADLNVV